MNICNDFGSAVNGSVSGKFEPLRGVRVIDFTRVLAGPYASMMLAELGADVIKVESPHGDETRSWGPPFVDDSSAYFHAVNQGKRSVTADLRNDESRQWALELIGSADVVLENFRPGVTARLGISPDEVLSLYPWIVYGSITGFGTVGPLADHHGTEVIVEAESGMMNITGEPGGEPMRFGVAMIDIATGLSLNNAVMAALIEKGRTGNGRHVEVSLFGTAISALGTVIASASAGEEHPRAWGSAHPSIVPYRAFRAHDGYIVLGATNDSMFSRLRTALRIPDEDVEPSWATNPGRVADRERVEATVQECVGQLSTDEVVRVLRGNGVLVAKVMTPEEAVHSEQARALRLATNHDGILYARSSLSSNGTATLSAAPSLGQHTEILYSELNRTAGNQEAHRPSG